MQELNHVREIIKWKQNYILATNVYDYCQEEVMLAELEYKKPSNYTSV